jgi:hypothetical protein
LIGDIQQQPGTEWHFVQNTMANSVIIVEDSTICEPLKEQHTPKMAKHMILIFSVPPCCKCKQQHRPHNTLLWIQEVSKQNTAAMNIASIFAVMDRRANRNQIFMSTDCSSWFGGNHGHDQCRDCLQCFCIVVALRERG